MRWKRLYCPPDTGLEIRALAVWGRARYLSVTDAPLNIESLQVSGEETLCFFETCRPEWDSNPRSPTFQADSLQAALTTIPGPPPYHWRWTFNGWRSNSGTLSKMVARIQPPLGRYVSCALGRPTFPTDTRLWNTVGLTLFHRRRRWINVKPT